MPLPVKGAGISVRAAADGLPCNKSSSDIGVRLAVIIQHAGVDRDICRQHGVGAKLLLYALQCTVNHPRKPVKLGLGADLIHAVFVLCGLQRRHRIARALVEIYARPFFFNQGIVQQLKHIAPTRCLAPEFRSGLASDNIGPRAGADCLLRRAV